MNSLSPFKVIASIVLTFLATSLVAQNCSNPQILCGQSGPENLTTADGVDTPVPGNFCFNNAENAVFFQFETLDLNQFPGLSYQDSSATLSIANISCDPDTLLGQGLLLAVFTAADACDFTTFNTPVLCDTLLQSEDLALSGLEPSTTYYIMVSGFVGDAPAINPSECEVSISVGGPAVTYDLEADWYPEGDENRNILLSGETAILLANNNFGDYTWSGDNLNEAAGNMVTANPIGMDETFEYIVETTINGCIFTDVVTIPVRPAIVPYNAFTPNGDGFNDAWEIKDITKWPNAQINVYSRWGTRVFQATNYGNDWNGDDLPAATYYYVIELNPVDFNSEPYTGSVTILR